MKKLKELDKYISLRRESKRFEMLFYLLKTIFMKLRIILISYFQNYKNIFAIIKIET